MILINNTRLNIKTMILGKILLVAAMISGCDTRECRLDYYNTNKSDLTEIRELSKTLGTVYSYEKITIMLKHGQVEVGFHKGSGNNASMYLDPVDHSLITEHPTSKCSAEALEEFRAMYNDNNLRQVLSLITKIEPKSMKIAKGGVFVALGEPLNHPNKHLKGGIFMTYESGFIGKRIVEEIETNVYLYDTIIY